MVKDEPQPFGYKMEWWAIRSTDRAAIVDALRVTNLRETTWEEGVDAAYDHHGLNSYVFITPSINGWTLVVHYRIPGDIHEYERVALDLSRQFGEVQAFQTHRIVEAHSWILAKNGVLLRSYSYVGESGRWLADFGEPTPAELSISWKTWHGRWWPHESNVMEIAGQWSVDPTSLGPETPCQGVPWLAEFPLE